MLLPKSIPAALVLALGALALPACNGDDTNKQLACPAKGLGITASTGESCSDVLAKSPKSAAALDCLAQLADFKKYNCQEPQVCLDQTKFAYVANLDPLAAPSDIHWTITNCAGGPKAKKLTIKGLAIAGDDKCFFTPQPEVESKLLDAGQQIFMRVEYRPKALGENHAAVYLITDAQNYPKMILPFCVKVRDKPPASVDAGAKGDAAASAGDAAVLSFDCTDVKGACNETCHPGCGAVTKM